MKNIFKLMGVALLACSLTFVACSKDEEEGNDPTPDPQPQPTTGIAVTFGSSNWNAGVGLIFTGNIAQYNVAQYIIFKEAQSYPYVNLMISSTPGTWSATAELGQVEPGQDTNYPAGYDYYSWPQQNELYRVDYFAAQGVQTQTTVRGDYTAKAANLTVTAIDLNSLTATFNLTATMYDYYSWYYGVIDNASDCDEKAMTVNVNNFTFTETTK